MASRRFFGYDPYDYYYAAPSYIYPYYPTPARSAEPVAVRPRQAPTVEAVNPKPRPRTVSIPVHFVGSEPEPPRKRVPSAEAAAVRVQAAARGFLARRAVRSLREVEREAEEVARKVEREAEALRSDARARVAVGEALMRLLLRLDAVRGAREVRRSLAKRVLALQDAVDALERMPMPVGAAAEEHRLESDPVTTAHDEGAEKNVMSPEHGGVDEAEMEVDGDRANAEACVLVETEQALDGANNGDTDADESGLAAELQGTEMEAKAPADMTAEMEVDGDRAAAHPCLPLETEPEQDGANTDAEESGVAPELQGASAEMDVKARVDEAAEIEVDGDRAAAEPCLLIKTEQAPDGANQGDDVSHGQQGSGSPVESAEPDRMTEVSKAAEAGGVDTKKVMEMVAALCERSAQQCAVIGALAERVDALERAVRQVEDADRRRRRAKKLKKQGKGSVSQNKCGYLD